MFTAAEQAHVHSHLALSSQGSCAQAAGHHEYGGFIAGASMWVGVAQVHLMR